ncbi:hypothetical protein FB451DRAFT_1183698 [Mycena latifolia]|nr:hypothetical protein FB451DRAFT_1183698 [Mycena latifolia]
MTLAPSNVARDPRFDYTADGDCLMHGVASRYIPLEGRALVVSRMVRPYYDAAPLRTSDECPTHWATRDDVRALCLILSHVYYMFASTLNDAGRQHMTMPPMHVDSKKIQEIMTANFEDQTGPAESAKPGSV